MILKKFNKKGIFVDLLADISGVILFVLALLVFILVLQIKSCTSGDSSFDASFVNSPVSFLNLELLKTLNLNTDLTIRTDSAEHILTPNELICLSYNGSDGFNFYNRSRLDFVTLSKEDLFSYIFDFIVENMNLTYGQIDETQNSLKNFKVLNLFFYPINQSSEPYKTNEVYIELNYYFISQVVPCSNGSIRVGVMISE